MLLDAGVSWIDASAAGVTVSVALLELTPFSDAEITGAPTPTAVARPLVAIVAFAVSLEFQATVDVMSCVVASV